MCWFCSVFSYAGVSDNDFERLLNGEVELSELIPAKPEKKVDKK